MVPAPFSAWRRSSKAVASCFGSSTRWPVDLPKVAGETIEQGRFLPAGSANWPSTGKEILCQDWKLQWHSWEDERQGRAGRVPPEILKLKLCEILKHSLPPPDPSVEIFTCTPAQMLNWTKVWGRPRICNDLQWQGFAMICNDDDLRCFAMTRICNDLQWRGLAKEGVGNT